MEEEKKIGKRAEKSYAILRKLYSYVFGGSEKVEKECAAVDEIDTNTKWLKVEKPVNLESRQ